MTTLMLLLLGILTYCGCTLELNVERIQQLSMLNTVFLLMLFAHGLKEERNPDPSITGLF